MAENYFNISLPSKCLVYPGVNPADVKIRPFKGKDEKFIASMNYENLEKKFVELLKNVFVGVQPEKLTIGDRLYLLVWEVVNSYSPTVDAEIICKNCFQRVVVTLDLSKLEVQELPDNYKEPYPITLSDGTVVNMRLFRVEDEIKVVDYEKINPDSWLYRYALSIVSDEPIDKRVVFLENLPTKDIALIRGFHDKFYHGPIMEAPYVCPKCEIEEVVACPFRFEWLIPAGKTLIRIIGDRI